MRFLGIFSVMAFIAMQSASAWAKPQGLLPGSWEFDIKYDLIGIPQTFPGYTVKQCMDAKTPYPSISQPGREDECQAQMQRSFARTYTWMMDCSSDWEMVQGMGRIHYYGEKARGDVHLQILNPHNPPQSMVFRIKGRHLGECKD